MTRDELVRAACLGDVRARNALGPWLTGHLEQFFANVRADLERIEDIHQETMVELWAKLPEKDPKTADELLGLLFRFAVICCHRARTGTAREHKRQAKHEQAPEHDLTRSPTTKLAQREIAERYLTELPTPLREPVRWTLAGGTLREFAAEHEIPEGTVRRHYHEAIKRLRERLVHDGLSPSQLGL